MIVRNRHQSEVNEDSDPPSSSEAPEADQNDGLGDLEERLAARDGEVDRNL